MTPFSKKMYNKTYKYVKYKNEVKMLPLFKNGNFMNDF